MGAVLRIRTAELPLAALLATTPSIPVMGAVLGGQNVFEMTLPTHGLLVIGNEGRGISPEVEALLTHRLTIPRHPQGKAESLNAAVAAGILAAQVGWQKKFLKKFQSPAAFLRSPSFLCRCTARVAATHNQLTLTNNCNCYDRYPDLHTLFGRRLFGPQSLLLESPALLTEVTAQFFTTKKPHRG